MSRSRRKRHNKNKINLNIFFLLAFFFMLAMSINFIAGILKDRNHMIVNGNTSDINEENIVILGSEPEAITAAVINARLGYKVNLVTEDEVLGGLFTNGMLTAFDINYEKGKKILHEGFFDEFYDNSGNGFNLDLIKTQKFFDEIVKHKNITVIKSAKNITPIVNNNKNVVGVYYEKDGQDFEIDADFVFDGSYEAEFTRKLGAIYRTGRSEFGKPNEYAAAGIMFSLTDIDWKEISENLKHDNDKETGVTKNAAWGYKEMYNYKPQNDTFKMRGLNISRQDDESIILNALLVIGVDPLDKTSYENKIKEAQKEIPLIVEYMRENLDGFENAKLDKIAKDLYIREGVRIVGEETLDGYDIIAHTVFEDVVGYGSYPADLQTATKENYGNALNGNSMYGVPLGVMMPKGIENVVVLGRCASFDIVAHSSARTVPVLMSMAEGASYAVDYALQNNLTLSEVRENYMDEVHKNMVKIGKMNMPAMPKNEYEDSIAKDAIKHLRQKGLITTKYFEIIHLKDKADVEQIKSIINLAREYTQIEFSKNQVESLNRLKGEVNKENLLNIISILVNKRYENFNDIVKVGIISEETFKLVETIKDLNNEHLYIIMSDYIKYMQKDFREILNQDDKNIIIKK